MSDDANQEASPAQVVEALERFSAPETQAERLARLHGELLEINHTIFLTDAALGSRDGCALQKLVSAAQVSLTFIRNRLDDLSEEIEELVTEAREAEKPAN